MDKINPEIEKLNKKIQDLTIFAERQQGVLELYRKRFNRIKRCLYNPLFAIRFFWDYYKKKHWRNFYKEVSPQEYTKWIKEKESELDLPLPTDSADNSKLLPGYVMIKGDSITLNSFSIALINQTILKHPKIDVIYGDEDVLDSSTKLRSNPYFKPDYSPDTLLSFNYIGEFFVIREGLLSEDELNGTNYYDLILRACEKANLVYHIPAILFHKDSKARISDSYYEDALFAQKDALSRRKIKAGFEKVLGFSNSRIIYETYNEPKVSIIIPSKDNYEILKKCLESLLEKTLYRNFEIVLVDNGSKDACKSQIQDFLESLRGKYIHTGISYIYEPLDFNFSKMCNIGASNAKGEYLLFLNDDIEIVDGIFLERMLGAAMQPHIGAVGAKLLYPGGNIIQHDGVVDMANSPVHALHFGDDTVIYYHGRNRFDFNCSAVTGAALLVSKEKYNAVGGFNEEMAVGFNDIDLCYKLLESGYYNLIRNDAILIHHESISRGTDFNSDKKHKRLLKEQHILNMSHPAIIAGDPFYHPLLTQTNTDYSLAIKEF